MTASEYVRRREPPGVLSGALVRCGSAGLSAGGGGGVASSISPVLYEAVMIPIWVGVGVLGGGGLFADAFFLRRFGVEGRSGVADSASVWAVAVWGMPLDSRASIPCTALVPLLAELFMIFLGLLIELVGSLTTLVD